MPAPDARWVRDWVLVGAGFVAVVAVATFWFSLDRRPPEWDHANHLERAIRCARDLGVGDIRAVLDRSSFYPPVVPCSAGMLGRLIGSDAVAGQVVVLAFLGVGMAATYLLGRRAAGGTGGVLAALLLGTAPYVAFSMLRFQLDLPLAAMVAVALEVLLRTERFSRSGWSVAAAIVCAVGMLIKPPFAAYVLPTAVWVAAGVGSRRAVGNIVVSALVVATLLLPWYGPRLFGLQGQIAARSFKQAAESGHPDPFTWAALAIYPGWFPTQFGVAAAALFGLGFVVAVWRRHWWLLVALLVPFLGFELLRNKNLRYTLPLLPVAAVVAAVGFSALGRRGQALAGAALVAMAGLQVSATAFDRPSWRLPVLGIPLAFASPPVREAWPHEGILRLIERHAEGRPATVSIVPNHEFFSTSNFRYYGLRGGHALTFVRAWDEEPLGVEYMVVKTGAVGPPWTEAKIRRVMDRLGADPHLARVFPVIADFALPDGSTASVRARRVPEEIEASPVGLAAAVDAALKRRLADFAREIEGLRVELDYDPAILRGRIARLDIDAVSATVAEFKRPKAARLRVNDVRLVLEDVLINPFAASIDGRLDVLDIGAVRVDRATITASDLQAFLDGLPRFRPTVALDRGAVSVAVRHFGPDVTGRVRLVPATDRPFTIVADRVWVGGIPLPDGLVNWAVRSYDPSAAMARRLPMPVTIGRVTIGPEAIRISPGGPSP